MNHFYVYCHRFLSDDEVFYIGKGSGDRFKSKNRSQKWKDTVQDREYYAVKIQENLTEDEAIDLENKLLQEFKPKANTRYSSSKVKAIDYELISKIVVYDETSPTFLRYLTDRANGAIKAGSPAGSFDSDGYGQVFIKDKIYKIHRIIVSLFLRQDVDRSLVVDHIDGNKSNNNINNLRLVTASENSKNIDWSKAKPSNTGEKGISLRDNSYRVLWSENGKQYEKSFSFGSRSKRTKEQALEEAVSFRNSKT